MFDLKEILDLERTEGVSFKLLNHLREGTSSYAEDPHYPLGGVNQHGYVITKTSIASVSVVISKNLCEQ